MTYNDYSVIFGGLIHIPILIIVLKLIENIFKKNKMKFLNN